MREELAKTDNVVLQALTCKMLYQRYEHQTHSLDKRDFDGMKHFIYKK